MLATELNAAQYLLHIATQLINAHGIEALHDQILDAAMAILHPDFASIQMFYPERGTNGELRLVGHRGFNVEAAKRWQWVQPTNCTACGEALRTGRRVVVPDVGNCDFMSCSGKSGAQQNRLSLHLKALRVGGPSGSPIAGVYCIDWAQAGFRSTASCRIGPAFDELR